MPREYYDDFDWSYTFNFHDTGDEWWNLMASMFKAIPLNFQELLNGSELPNDMPESMKKLLLKPTTMYDFFVVMTDFTDSLTNQLKEFKQLLQYLHKNSLLLGMYESMEITGYDGINVTDKAAFYDSYARKFIQEGKSESRYDLYLDMFNGLEFYGFVKGKPKKQKMMNLINDARHSFFGSVCDVIVSKDNDFLEKTRFMYNLERIGTKILPAFELEQFLDEQAGHSALSIDKLFSELNEPIEESRILEAGEVEGAEKVYFELKNSYYSYFNLVGIISDEYGWYWSVCRKLINHNNTPFKLQIRHIVDRLLSELGSDIHHKGTFTYSEQLDNKSEIRTWVVNEVVISLILDDVLYLNIYSLDYLKKRWEQKG
jgi:hypothetical protein